MLRAKGKLAEQIAEGADRFLQETKQLSHALRVHSPLPPLFLSLTTSKAKALRRVGEQMREGECAGKGNGEAGKQIANIPGMPEEMKKEGKFERKQADRQGG